MKNMKLNGTILFIITIAILVYVLKDNFAQTFELIGNANLLWILLAMVLYCISLFLESYITKTLVKQYKKDYTHRKAFKLSIMTKFFNGITPMAAGGRPLQIFEYKKEGIKYSDGTNVIVQNFIIFQVSLLSFSLVGFFLASVLNIFSYDSILFKMTFAGFALNFLVLGVAILLSFSKQMNKKIVRVIIKVLNKLHIVKNVEKQTEKWDKSCLEYYEGFKSFKHSKELIVKGILIEIIALMFEFSIPLCIFNALGNTIGLNVFSAIIAGQFIFLTGSYIPLPGGTGGIEYAFLGYYSNFIIPGVNLLSPALILWRFTAYYLPTLIGGFAFNIRKKKVGGVIDENS